MVRLASIIIAVLGMVIAWNVTPPAEKRILFIGNSYTFGGQIPEQLRRIAATSDPPAKYLVKSHVRAGTSLSQHIAETGALEAIRAQDWDVVVLQDASRMSFRPDWRDEMRQAPKLWRQPRKGRAQKCSTSPIGRRVGSRAQVMPIFISRARMKTWPPGPAGRWPKPGCSGTSAVWRGCVIFMPKTTITPRSRVDMLRPWPSPMLWAMSIQARQPGTPTKSPHPSGSLSRQSSPFPPRGLTSPADERSPPKSRE